MKQFFQVRPFPPLSSLHHHFHISHAIHLLFLFLFPHTTQPPFQLWTQSWMQPVIEAWRVDDKPPRTTTPDMKDKLFNPNSSFKDRLSVLRYIARFYQTNLVVRCVMAGMTGVGKSTFVKCSVTKRGARIKPGESGRTQGLEVAHHRVDRGKDVTTGFPLPTCSVIFQDFGGHTEYWALQGGFLRSTCIVFLCVDLVRVRDDGVAALEEAGVWLDGVWEEVVGDGRYGTAGVVIVGTKADLVGGEAAGDLLGRVVDVFEGRRVGWSRLAVEASERARKRRFEVGLESEGPNAAINSTSGTSVDGSAGAGAGAGAGFEARPATSAAPLSSHSSTDNPPVPIRLMAAASVSSTSNSVSLLPSFRRPDASNVKDSHSLLCYVLHVAPEYLPGYFGADHPPSTVSASEKLLSLSSEDRMGLFGGKWVLPWPDFSSLAPTALDLVGSVDMESVVSYLESVGAVVTLCPSPSTYTRSPDVLDIGGDPSTTSPAVPGSSSSLGSTKSGNDPDGTTLPPPPPRSSTSSSTEPGVVPPPPVPPSSSPSSPPPPPPSDAASSPSPSVSWVVVAPSILANAVSAVMNHRFVGAGEGIMDVATSTMMKEDATAVETDSWAEASRKAAIRRDQDAVRSEWAVMLGLLGRAESAGHGTRSGLLKDDWVFGKTQALTRRYLVHVLLHPDRHRCKLTTPPDQREEVGLAVWEALKVLEYGVIVTPPPPAVPDPLQRMLLPYLACLQYMMSGAPPPPAVKLGVGVGDASAMAGVVTSAGL